MKLNEREKINLICEYENIQKYLEVASKQFKKSTYFKIKNDDYKIELCFSNGKAFITIGYAVYFIVGKPTIASNYLLKDNLDNMYMFVNSWYSQNLKKEIALKMYDEMVACN